MFPMPFLDTDFFSRDVLDVAHDLVGVELVWNGCSGVIVETEAYAVEGDPACHTAHRPSAREFVKSKPPGAAYVYFNYGMYWLFNLHVKGGERDGLILIRALEPVSGIEMMMRRRRREKPHELCSGPGKLALALDIHGEHHGRPMAGRGRPAGCGLRLTGRFSESDVVSDVRVGISQAADFKWRFLAKDSPDVSVKHGKVKAPQ
jgi:DNA-3-methyladenine glycosylase